MPVDIFGYYTLLEPYITAYYKVDSIEKAKQLYHDVSAKYQENLTYYSNLPEEDQASLIEEIYTDIERYRGLVDVLVLHSEESDFVEAEMQKFNEFIRLFGGEDEEPQEEAEQLDIRDILNEISQDSILGDSTVAIDPQD